MQDEICCLFKIKGINLQHYFTIIKQKKHTCMNKKTWIIITIAGVILIGSIAYLVVTLQKQKQENKAMLELAELDKKEMEWQRMYLCQQRLNR